MPGRAYGADPVFQGPKRFVCIGSTHGAVMPKHRDPADTESGWSTHDAQDLNVITFGSANGYFKTGNYVDYRNLSPTCRMGGRQLGLNYRQFLANCRQAMGIPRADFETGRQPGYGSPYSEDGYASKVHSDVINKASDPLPVVTA